MTRDITPAGWPATGAVDEAFAEVGASFDRFCLAAGIEALGTMMEADVTGACGPRHGRDAARRAHRWGRTRGRIGFHGGKIEVERPRVRGVDGREVMIPSWETAAQEDWLGRWAMNLMLINVSTRRFGRAVYQRGVTLDFSRPGQPTDNAFIEAFNGRFRAECLNAHWFLSIADAQQKVETWRRYFNPRCHAVQCSM
ncbi:hypothetical protein ABIA00_003264 [Bradyrhizobium ottawaense]